MWTKYVIRFNIVCLSDLSYGIMGYFKFEILFLVFGLKLGFAAP
jgi:uncharacterized membrane protein YuzA (DUF378 family)